MSLTNYKAAKSQIALEALSMAPETTQTIECPICQGGQSREKKLSVTRRAAGAIFMCFRASCGFRGFVSLEGGETMAPIRPRKAAHPYRGEFRQGTAFCKVLMDSYPGFHEYERPGSLVGWGVGYSAGVTIFKCRDLNGRLLGHVTRTPGKAIKTYLEPGADCIYSAYLLDGVPRHGAPIVIVEDCISAMAVASHGYDSVALLGTNLPSRLKDDLKATGRRLLVMLDPDAYKNAFCMAEDLECPYAIGHTKDPKDMPALGEFLEIYL